MKKPTAPTTETAGPKKKKLPKYLILTEIMTEGRTLIALEALSEYGDTCLHTTISYLTHEYGLHFIRTPEKHRHRGGGSVYFTRYKLAPDSIKKAEALIKFYKQR
ncbi:hypothetical protein [Marinobacterium aestuariivivens]|uniref:Uncharacterized protein n=1 Tax=Marinobacterium aestuariivivens TaxID=1698799 RepID=A0ABW2A521_9GAMM